MNKYLSYSIAMLLLCLAAGPAFSQFNNEWIDYNKNYYKFTVGKSGFYRINKNVLDAAGLGTSFAEHFQLWRNGQQVPLFVSKATGLFGATDFIEFYGAANDGKPDRPLFRDAATQADDTRSLFTDTAAFFLTINTAGTNSRYTSVNNGSAGSGIAIQPYVWRKSRYNYIFSGLNVPYVNRGVYQDFGEDVFSSSFEAGEMLSSEDIFPKTLQGVTIINEQGRFQNLNPYTGGPSAQLKVLMAGSAQNNRQVKLSISNTPVIETSITSLQVVSLTNSNVNPSLLQGNTTTLSVQNLSANNFDRVVISFAELTYPALPDASGNGTMEIFVPASANAQHIAITGINNGGLAPVLYDPVSATRMIGEANGNGFRYLIPASSTDKRMYIVAQQAGVATSIGSLQQKAFFNFGVASNQANFIIISHPFLIGGSASAVNAYRNYRASAAGGGYNAKIFDINELTDQFAFGIKTHPLSIKNFLRYARQNFGVKPAGCLLIGKGVTYDLYRAFESNPKAPRLQLIPTYGYPASDNLLASDDLTAVTQTPIGRINAISNEEVNIYLNKLKTYEAQQANTDVSQQENLWKKNVVHVVGANDAGTETLIRPYMNLYERLISDTMYGGKVTTFNKFNSSTASTIESEQLNNLFAEGFSLMTYFGHSSASALDYNLDDPNQYNNPNKYPVFLLNGCNAGNFFTFDTGRLEQLNTISERYVFANNRGAIALIASTHFGLVNGLGIYSDGFYRSVSSQSFNNNLGKNINDAIRYTYDRFGANSFIGRIHAEQQTLHGDPVLKINVKAKPDYSIETSNIRINPSFISIAEQTFSVQVRLINIGKAITDSFVVRINRKYPPSAFYPTGSTETVYQQKIKAPLFEDSLKISLPILPERDKGNNQLEVTLDANSTIDEMSELNNTATATFAIFENEIRPVYPYNFAIINTNTVTLTASTANALAERATYRFEMDTTSLFNSPAKRTADISSVGGVVRYAPGISLPDSSTWFWRVGTVENNNPPTRWNQFSFKYISGTETGFGQQSKWQHLQSTNTRIKVDSTTGRWNFGDVSNNVFVNHSIYPTSGTEDNDFSVIINGSVLSASACVGHSLIFNVFEPNGFKPWRNYPGGAFGSGNNTCVPNVTRQYNYEWDDRDTANRRRMMQFFDQIPNGHYVIVRKILDAPYDQETYAPIWKNDEQYFGAGNTLYHRFKNAGFAAIDSFNRARTFVFFFKKNDNGFTPVTRMSEGIFDRVQMNTFATTRDTVGFISSPIFGPAKAWKTMRWDGNSDETPANESVRISLIGISRTGSESILRTYGINEKVNDISDINPTLYPQLRLAMRNADSTAGTPYQLRFWRLFYDPVPEGALAGNIFLSETDSIPEGQPIQLGIAFTNISNKAFDSILVKSTLTAANNSIVNIPHRRLKPLQPGQTDTIRIAWPSAGKQGLNTLYVAANPDNDQPEQTFINNFLYKSVTVLQDDINPVLDVTFDGQHILNRDIVSAKPHVQMILKDENGFLALNDTADMEVLLYFPGSNTPRLYRWGTDTLQFTPGDPATGKNEAIIDFVPALTQDTENSEYQLVVRGKDRVGNPAGKLSYRIAFRVFNKPMISNLMNYPNPFSTSTAFVFTITGTEIPQEFKIQILSVTGKIVREITAAELGDLHIGTNITEYKWDGTDTYGQKLANGVYLYRVVSSLNGQQLDRFRLNDGYDQQAADVTDQYFKKGYGKMVILR